MVKTTDLARELRQRQTSYEALAWQLLRNRRFLGLKFRRQQPFGAYILDFYCEELRLAIELDGAQHGEPRAIAYDAVRDDFLRSKRITIVRIDNQDLESSTGEVLWKLQAIVKGLRRRD